MMLNQRNALIAKEAVQEPLACLSVVVR